MDTTSDYYSPLPDGWNWKFLSEIANISLSSVDKKSSLGEIPVRLCNYNDVYSNRRIHGEIDFMVATATERELARFQLREGDIVFTKDSETPEDIAVPAYVVEDLDRVVCGYHLAIAKVKRGIDGIFLCYAMQETAVRRQFTRVASGTTRFGLSINSFDKVAIPMPSLAEQRNIATILASVDEVIEILQLQINKLRDVKSATMNELLTKGSGHAEFQDDSDIGKLFPHSSPIFFKKIYENGIPPSWTWQDLSEVATPKQWGYLPQTEFTEQGFPVYGANGLVGFYSAYNHAEPVIAISCRGACGDIHLTRPFSYVSSNAMCLDDLSEEVFRDYLFYALTYRTLDDAVSGSAQPQITKENLRGISFPLPPLAEQQRIASVLTTVDTLIEKKQYKLQKSQHLKKSLMQDLLTGTIQIQSRLTAKQGVAKRTAIR